MRFRSFDGDPAPGARAALAAAFLNEFWPLYRTGPRSGYLDEYRSRVAQDAHGFPLYNHIITVTAHLLSTLMVFALARRPVDMRKKVMRRAYKVNGYRVQVFAGGNSRNDKIKAQNAGNAMKMAFPSQPIYVHFYSPRWICRMGNYRTYEEASAILHQVQKMGYKQACIVSGKITVAY